MPGQRCSSDTMDMRAQEQTSESALAYLAVGPYKYVKAGRMHPLFLNFTDNGVEKEYRNLLLSRVVHTSAHRHHFRVLIRFAILARESLRQNNSPTGMATQLILLIFIAMPVMENAILKRMPRVMFFEHGERVETVLGAMNAAFLTLAMKERLFNDSNPLVPLHSIDEAALKVFVLCSGVLLHIFNVWWYPLRFRKFIILAAYTFVITTISQTFLACREILVRSKLMNTLRDAACLLNLALHSMWLPASSLDKAVHCGASDAHSCRQTLVFTNLWVGLLGSLGWAWFSEKKSRDRFLNGLNAREGHQQIPDIAEMHWWEGVILYLLLLPLAWTCVVATINEKW